MGKATGHRRRTRNLSSQRIILEQITWCLFITSKECVGSSGNDVDTAGRVHIIPPDHLEMVRYSFLSVAAVQSSNSTHPHYGIQPTVSTVQPAALRSNSTHPHYGMQPTQCPPCDLLHLRAIPHIQTTVCSPHSVHRATCCTYEQFHTSTLRYAAHTVSTVQPAALKSNSTHPHYGMQPTVSTVQPAALRSNSTHPHYGMQPSVHRATCCT